LAGGCYHGRVMNLLMILLIILGIWVSGAICYFAWRMMPAVEKAPVTEAPEDPLDAGPAADDPSATTEVDPNAQT